MKFKEYFDRLYAHVQQSGIAAVMAKTVEDSPWHREANTWVHTEMVVQQARERANPDGDYSRSELFTLIAALFHDFGKPAAEETLEKEGQPGVTYRRYSGHEVISANAMIQYFLVNTELLDGFYALGFDNNDLRGIRFMVEYHLPYSIKDKQKRSTIMQNLRYYNVEQAFYNLLVSDCAGRISDDHPTKLKAVDDWIKEFRVTEVLDDRGVQTALKVNAKLQRSAPCMVLLCGPSGSGKSTYLKTYLAEGDILVNEDDYRLEYAVASFSPEDLATYKQLGVKAQYDMAWKFCHLNKDSQYDKFAKAKFEAAVATGKKIFLDRTNQSRKNRSYWVNTARQKGYRIVAVEFWVPEAALIARQISRPEKQVPSYRVSEMVYGTQMVQYGTEADEVVVVVNGV